MPTAPKRPQILRTLVRSVYLYLNLLPFVLLHLAVLAVFFVVPENTAEWAKCLGLFVGLFLVRTWGLTGGFHRYFSHRTYKTSRVMQFLIGCLGSSAFQKGPMWWAAEHRQHHRHSDKPGDPHSPIVYNFWWSHIGWVMDRNNRFTDWNELKDWHAYPELKWLDRFHFVPGFIVAGLCYAIAGWPGVIWGFICSTVMLYHTTFCVNSVCHIFGYRRYDTGDHSRNNWLVAMLTLGEGWHNNHHHYPSCARQGFTWYEVDVTYIVLRMMAKVGLVWDVREPTPRARVYKLLKPTAQ